MNNIDYANLLLQENGIQDENKIDIARKKVEKELQGFMNEMVLAHVGSMPMSRPEESNILRVLRQTAEEEMNKLINSETLSHYIIEVSVYRDVTHPWEWRLNLATKKRPTTSRGVNGMAGDILAGMWNTRDDEQYMRIMETYGRGGIANGTGIVRNRNE